MKPNSIISTALESLETPVPTVVSTQTTQEAVATATAAQQEPTIATGATAGAAEKSESSADTKILELEKSKMVFNGALSNIMTRALNIAYAKKDPVTSKFEGVEATTAAVGMESQAQDVHYIRAANRVLEQTASKRSGDIQELQDTQAKSGTGTKLVVPVTVEETIRFFNNDDVNEELEFVFYNAFPASTDGAAPRYEESSKMLILNEKTGEGLVVESIQIVVKTRPAKEEQEG